MSREARRFLALHLPDFATDRLQRAEPDPGGDEPLVIWVSEGPRRIVAAVNAAAAQRGLRPGQALADAQALVPSLGLRPADPAGDAGMLQRLALWARRFTPLAAVDPPDGLLLDITGCAHLLGGEAGLMQDALTRLQRAGFAARGAVAGAAATAGALARARGDAPIVVNGAEAVIVGPLPLGLALRLDAGVSLALARLGMRRVGDLQALPRASLARRFGAGLLHQLDAVTGQRREALHPVQPPPELAVMQDLAEPVVTRAGIEALLDRLLEALGGKLREAGRGARQVALLAWRIDGEVQEIAVRAGQPTRTAAHLRYLFRDRLERLEPGLGFERMALEARATDPMAAGVQAAFAVGGHRDEGAGPALAQLLDRIRQRMQVHRAAPRASHWPERMVTRLDPYEDVPAVPPGWVSAAPVLLLRRPHPIDVVALLPDGPPSLLRWRGTAHRVLRAAGPHRLEPAWWRGPKPPPGRDYHRVELASGIRLWVYRAGPDAADPWLLHGHLP